MEQNGAVHLLVLLVNSHPPPPDSYITSDVSPVLSLFSPFDGGARQLTSRLTVGRCCGVSLDIVIVRQTAVFIDGFREWCYYRERGQNIGLKGIGRFEMTDGAAAWPQEAVYRSHPSGSAQLCVTVQFEGRDGTS